MKSFLLRFALPLLLGAFIGFLIVHRISTKSSITNSSTSNIISVNLKNARSKGVLSAYGFYPDMNINDFGNNVEALGKIDNPFVDQKHILSPDYTTVTGMVLIFPTEKFETVAKEIVKENGPLPCEKKDDNIICEIKDKAGNVLLIANQLMKDKDGNSFGAVLITDKQHAPPPPKTTPDSQVSLFPNQEYTALQYGKV